MARRLRPGGGRKALPTAIKLLRGNPGRRSISGAIAVEARIDKSTPQRLRICGPRLWKEITEQLEDLGIVAKCDRGAIALLVESRERWERCLRKVLELGDVIETKDGKLYRNPWAIAAEKASAQYRAMCAEFGLTPSTRASVVGRIVGDTPKAADTTTRFFESPPRRPS